MEFVPVTQDKKNIYSEKDIFPLKYMFITSLHVMLNITYYAAMLIKETSMSIAVNYHLLYLKEIYLLCLPTLTFFLLTVCSVCPKC